MRILDQISALVAVRGAAEGSGLKRCTSVGASMGMKLSPDLSVEAIWYDTEALD